jgi:hypothetical protein
MSRGCVYLIYEAGNFRPALDLCVAMKNKYGVAPVLFSPYYLPDTEKYIELSKIEGIPYVHEVTSLGGYADTISQLHAYGIQTSSLTSKVGDSKTKKQGFLSRARNTLASWALNKQNKEISDWKAYYLTRIEVVANFLAAVDAISLILPEDNVERDSSCWCRAIHERGGRATVVSYGSITPHEAAVAYFDNSDYVATTPEERLFLWLYPKWKIVFKERTMLRLPVARAYVMERMGLAPTRPWVVNTGQVDGIAVESEFMRNLFAQHGVSLPKIRPTGHSAFDMLSSAASRRQEIREFWSSLLGYDQKQAVLLCAMPPDQYPGVTAPEFSSYDALVDGWLSALEKVRSHFFPVISPHPNISNVHLDRIRSAGFHVLEGGVANWLPACDIYLASVSSTIKWARACGKPVLNYDCYRYYFDDYLDAPYVLTVFDLALFEAELEKLTEPHEFFQLTSASRENREYWGVLDGQAMERLVEYISTKTTKN